MLIIVGLSLITPKQKSELARFYGSGGDTYFIEYVTSSLFSSLSPLGRLAKPIVVQPQRTVG